MWPIFIGKRTGSRGVAFIIFWLVQIPRYHVNNAIKLGTYNVGRENEVLAIPLYMGFLIKDNLADAIVPDIELSALD